MKGMKEKEKKNRKLCYCAVFASAAIIYIVLGCLHAERTSNADKIQEDYIVKIGDDERMLAYDACKFPRFTLDPEVSELDLKVLENDVFKYCFESPKEC